MFEQRTPVSRNDPRFSQGPPPRSPQEPEQRRLMVVALTLLLVTLASVLYYNRNFWFPNSEEAEDQGQPPQSDSAGKPTQAAAAKPSIRKRSNTLKPQSNASSSADAQADPSAPPVTATSTRTVLPPLEIEVVAGNVHRTVHANSNAVNLDLKPDSPLQEDSPSPAVAVAPESAATVTNNASEHVQISTGTADIVRKPVKPGYPLLARQMKVQGSVILQAMIGKDGLIQDLRVVSGPPILATAAEEAVKQWHFKPHYQGSETVETEAKITVNFTISTN